jgi:hypothetical protein
MSLASPVWKDLISLLSQVWTLERQGLPNNSTEVNLNTTNDESKTEWPVAAYTSKNAPSTLIFTDFDYNALVITLHIAHFQFSEVPADIEFSTLVSLAKLCHKFKCVGLVKPFLQLWIKETPYASAREADREWLLIAWVFGKESIYNEVADALFWNITTNHEDALPKGMLSPIIGRSQVNIKMAARTLVNYFLQGFIMQKRLQKIAAMLAVLYNNIKKFEDSDKTICTQGHNQEACDAAVYGSLLRGLQKIGLWPRKSPEEINYEPYRIVCQA